MCLTPTACRLYEPRSTDKDRIEEDKYTLGKTRHPFCQHEACKNRYGDEGQREVKREDGAIHRHRLHQGNDLGIAQEEGEDGPQHIPKADVRPFLARRRQLEGCTCGFLLSRWAPYI